MDQTLTVRPPWSTGKKIAFRFFFLFFILYIFLNPNAGVPLSDLFFDYYITPFHSLIPWFAKHILHLSYDVTVFTNGSGDTTYDYLVFLFVIILSVIGMLIWTVADRKRVSYNSLYYWLTVIIRYYAAFTMFSYGIIKVFKLQFPYPDLRRLLQPYGESSPMGLAWTFMGYSAGYNYFTGFAEVITGVLLLFRRTATLGAVMLLIVMGNVMAMNYSFDIPVKLVSTACVFMAVFLLAKDAQRIINFFFLNRPAAPSDISAPKHRKKWVRISLTVFKVALVLYMFIGGAYGAYQSEKQYGAKAPKPSLYGIYDVQTFVKNNDTLPPLKTDTLRWARMLVNWSGYATIKLINDSSRNFVFRPDTTKKTITMFSNTDTTRKSLFAYSKPEKDILVMNGAWNGDSVYIRMKMFDINKFNLVNRKFSWINEYPFNR
jgi:hypothetical protein